MRARGDIMADNSWMSHPAWTDMDPEKKAVINELLMGCRGKKLNESASFIMAAMTMLRKKNLSFTKDEADVLIGEMAKGMDESEKARLEMMKNMIKNRQ